MSARPCRACGMPIEFIEGPSGKAIPVQKVRTVYMLDGGKLRRAVPEGPGVTHYISHFETCPHASSFSKRSSRPAPPARGSA